jgi:hypothetical protein
MNTTFNTTTKRLIAAFGVAAAGVTVPALLFAGAATAHADDCYDGSLAGSYYCSPASGSGISSQTPETSYQSERPSWMGSTPDQTMWNSLPQCSGGVLAALDGEC